VKTLDRYVLGIFLPALGVFGAAFTALFLAVDFTANLGKFLDLRTLDVLPFIGRYYACRLPMILLFVLPSILLFAPLFTLVKLARSNEIVPVAASGISLRRFCAPFLAAALASSGFMLVVDEVVLVHLVDEIAETGDILSSREVRHGVLARDRESLLLARDYDSVNRELSAVRVTWLDRDAIPVRVVTAVRARWDPERRAWIATDGVEEHPEELVEMGGGRPVLKRRALPPEGLAIEGTVGPEGLREGGTASDRYAGVPLREVWRDARENPGDSKRWMRFHGRLSFLFSPIVLLLIGLPPAVTAHSKSLAKGLVGGFLLVAGFYGLYFAALDFGSRGELPAFLAGWGPTLGFAISGAFGFGRMKT
jgi:lipopolysaccharide export LptBFGC system permease protein LptF